MKLAICGVTRWLEAGWSLKDGDGSQLNQVRHPIFFDGDFTNFFLESFRKQCHSFKFSHIFEQIYTKITYNTDPGLVVVND